MSIKIVKLDIFQDKATPVFIASQNGHRSVLLMLLAAGAAVDTRRNDGATPLWIAAQMGHDHICKVLLQNNAEVDAVRSDGATPLFKAAHKGYSAVTGELLKFRPNLGILPVSWMISGVVRKFWMFTDLVLLVQSSEKIRKGSGLYKFLIFCQMPNYKTLDNFSFSQNGESALHAAAMFGHLAVVKQLVAAGSDIFLKNQDGLTALQVASLQKYVVIVEYLKDRIKSMGV